MYPILRRNQLGASENGHSELPALLFQTGYLTIKEAVEEGSEFQFGIPNRKVLEGIMYGLLPFAIHSDDDMLSTDLYRLRRLANDGETEAMLRYLQSFLAGIGNRLPKKMPEIYYENNLYIIFTLIGTDEVPTSYLRHRAETRPLAGGSTRTDTPQTLRPIPRKE